MRHLIKSSWSKDLHYWSERRASATRPIEEELELRKSRSVIIMICLTNVNAEDCVPSYLSSPVKNPHLGGD